jgi:hypothetical protein
VFIVKSAIMENQNRAALQLVQEFSSITVDIIIRNIPSWPIEDVELSKRIYLDDDYIIDWITYWNFDFLFQKKFRISTTDESILSDNQQYYEYLEDLRQSFYSEVNEALENETHKFKILNSLSNYRTRFKDFLTNYEEEHSYEYSVNKVYITNSRVIFNKNEEKAILYRSKIRILSSFLSIQVNMLENILNFLNEKIDIVERFLLPQVGQQNEKFRTDKFSLNNTSNSESFEFVYPKLIEKPCFIEFVSLLIEYKCIDESEKKNMRRIFSGIKIKDPVVWTGDKGALRYLILQLRKKGIIKKPVNFSSIIYHHFS